VVRRGQGSRVADNPAAWPSGLGKGLQSPVRGFDSRRRLEHQDRQRTEVWCRIRAISSVGEHYLDTVGVTGSIPVSPTLGGPGFWGLHSFPHSVKARNRASIPFRFRAFRQSRARHDLKTVRNGIKIAIEQIRISI
jgi:hypothetical protein